ncbi:type II toxin-antitoxin system prevent-host-death family antitoxin [Herbiconiux sp. 11R-BC]|uniref:type II toxin-antitoxin system prevent-host-death family antitoxin n=1 Tax=Herbiconiux sp. 11R-BC TaxID=3111637 RepID=UPI003C0E5B93
MIAIPATEARQQWARTLQIAHREPVTITQHGRDSVMILDAEVATRALAALQDAEDAAAVDAAREEMAGGAPTVSLDELAAELGIVVD